MFFDIPRFLIIQKSRFCFAKPTESVASRYAPLDIRLIIYRKANFLYIKDKLESNLKLKYIPFTKFSDSDYITIQKITFKLNDNKTMTF